MMSYSLDYSLGLPVEADLNLLELKTVNPKGTLYMNAGSYYYRRGS